MSFPSFCRFLGCILTALYGLLAPWYLPEFTGPLYDNARYLELILLISLTALLAIIPNWRHQAIQLFVSMPSTVKRGIAALLLLALISSLNAQFPEKSLQEISLFMLLFMFSGICLFLTRNYTKLMDGVFIVFISLGALLFICHFIICYQTTIIVGSTFHWLTPFVTFSNVRFFSQYQAYTLPLLVIPLVAFTLPLRWRVIALILLACWWALHFASGSRSVWLALIATILFLLMFLRGKARQWLVWQFTAMLAGGLIYLAFNYFSIDSNSHGLGSITKRAFTDSGRLPLWQNAFEMIKLHPLLGIGPMHFAFNNFVMAAHPHNSILHIAAEYGLPELLIACYLVATLLKKAVIWCSKPTYGENAQINVALTASLVCGLGDSLLSGNIIMPHSQMMLFMVSGWLIGRNKTLALDPQPTIKYWQSLILIIVALSLITVQLNGMHSYYTYMENQQFSVQEYAHPRFWSDGHWAGSVR